MRTVDLLLLLLINRQQKVNSTHSLSTQPKALKRKLLLFNSPAGNNTLLGLLDNHRREDVSLQEEHTKEVEVA
jgi:hypothetical protein